MIGLSWKWTGGGSDYATKKVIRGEWSDDGQGHEVRLHRPIRRQFRIMGSDIDTYEQPNKIIAQSWRDGDGWGLFTSTSWWVYPKGHITLVEV